MITDIRTIKIERLRRRLNHYHNGIKDSKSDNGKRNNCFRDDYEKDWRERGIKNDISFWWNYELWSFLEQLKHTDIIDGNGGKVLGNIKRTIDDMNVFGIAINEDNMIQLKPLERLLAITEAAVRKPVRKYKYS